MIPKFRAWHKTWEEMGKVTCIHFDDKQSVISMFCEEEKASSALLDDEVILMQSTGLFDKKGVEIFEGDILKSNKYITSVFYENGAYCVKFRRTQNTTVTMNAISFIEKYKTKVIGNIYENPELLEVE